MDTITAILTLKAGREKPVQQHHPWIFSGAIHRVEGQPEPGDLVQVVDHNGRFLCQAYYNPHSQIRARILTWDEAPIQEDFWRAQIAQAIHARTLLDLSPHTTAYRLIHAEADGLPGLIVDRYGDYLVVQCLTWGIDRRQEMITHLLADLLQPVGIIERSDVAVRQKEKLPLQTGLLWGDPPPSDLIIRENQHQFEVDVWTGHKSGLYLDQRLNRTAVCQPPFVTNKDILNVFAYTGGFAIYAAAQGARTITNIDSAIPALEQAEKNIALNGFDRPQDEYIAGNAFDILRYLQEEGRQFDLVILDPPKFVHSQRDLKRAARGYKDLNLQAFHLLRPGGLLATFSCSGLMDTALFQKIIFGASLDANRPAQIMQHLGQAPDHPILLSFPESAYLKGFLLRVLN